MAKKPWAEVQFERSLFRARWLMAPFYLGLVLALVMLLVVFVRELIYYLPQAFVMGEGHMKSDGAILAILSLVDLSLAGNLLLIVIYSGYENFVSKLDLDEDHVDRPPWMGSVDFSGLKMKLIASIVAISAIALLKAFMELSEGKVLSDRSLMWLVVIHVTFVVSGVLLALMDWLAGKTDKH